MEESADEISITNILTEYLTYLILIIVVLFIIPYFVIYPGIFYGRWKTKGPVFNMETKDGSKIEGMLLTPPEPEKVKTTILYFHGNSGNMGNSTHLLSNLCEKLNCYVVTIDYRGFGMSYGFPSESGLINDGESVLERIFHDEKFKNTKKILYGHSLGGALVLSLLSKYGTPKGGGGVDGIILENTFTCIKDVSYSKYGKYVSYIPEFILDIILYPNSWNSRERIKDIKNIPTLFISSRKDEVLGVSSMDELYKLCKSPGKSMYKVEEGNHNNVFTVDEVEYIKNVQNFINKVMINN